MELSIYDVIKGIKNTPKSLMLQKSVNKITFLVNKVSNKIMIRNAVEKIWNVKVKNVRIINLHGKTRTVGRRTFEIPGIKKAIITLKKGYKIDLPDQYETMGLEEKTSKGKG